MGTVPARFPAERFERPEQRRARARLPLAVYRTLFTEVYDKFVPHLSREQRLWHGRRTFHIDGSTFSMPDTPQLQKALGMPSGTKPG